MNEKELAEIESSYTSDLMIGSKDVIQDLVAEVRRLNGELAMAMDAVDELSRQMAEIERLRAALDFYASSDSYIMQDFVIEFTSEILMDQGKHARKALQGGAA